MIKSNTVILLIALVIGLFVLEGLHTRREQRFQEQILTLQLENQKLNSLVNSKGDTINTQRVIITQSQEAIKSLTDSIFSLTKKQERRIDNIIAYFTERSKVRIDSVDVPYVDTLEMKRFSDSVEKRCQEVIQYMRDSTITVPRLAADSTPTYSAEILVTKQTARIQSLSIPDSSHYRIDEIKGGLFKPNYLEIKSFHTSPHIKVEGQNSVIYKPKKKPRILEKALFVVGGIFLGSKL